MEIGWTKTLAKPARAEYDATKGSPKRRAFPGNIYHEDRILDQRKRDVLQSGSMDLGRNLSLFAWALEKHCDFITQYNLHSQSDDAVFDAEFEAFVDEVSRPENFDVAGLHDRESFFRLMESNAVVAGDCAAVTLRSGHVQAVESDRIRNPSTGTLPTSDWVNGVRVDEFGKPLEYSIYSRGPGGVGYVEDRNVPAGNVLHHRYVKRFDQVRGVSPIASAINDFQDLYESKDLIIAKLKASQLVVAAFYRDSIEGLMPEAQKENFDNREGYELNLSKGPAVVDLDPGDRLEMIQGSDVKADTQNFLKLMAQIALKALNIPYSFFDESHSTFHGSRGSWIQYERACRQSRNQLIRVQNDWLAWRTSMEVATGNLKIPRKLLKEGWNLRRPWWEFVPVGMPWWDPNKEVDGDIKAIQAGLTSPQKVCRQRGTDFRENILQISESQKLAKEHGVSLVFNLPEPSLERVAEEAIEDSKNQHP